MNAVAPTPSCRTLQRSESSWTPTRHLCSEPVSRGRAHRAAVMEGSSSSREPLPHLPPELRLRILSLLPPNEMALSGRLACKDAAQHFSQPPQRTACPSQPLPGHAVTTLWCVEGAQAALRELPFVRKLLLLSRAAASGCEASVELAWQLLQPHVLPELLQTDRYGALLLAKSRDLALLLRQRVYYIQFNRYIPTDVGAAAAESGLARLLPSLEQRCPGLMLPANTLAPAAQHCNLPGLKAAWELLDERLRSSTKPLFVDPEDMESESYEEAWGNNLRTAWLEVLAAAARSTTHGAIAKMDWVFETRRQHEVSSDWSRDPLDGSLDVCAAAVSTGDMARVRWLRNYRHSLWADKLQEVVLEHADLAFIKAIEMEAGSYLHPAVCPSWHREECACAAAASRKDAMAKLRWLADRGSPLEYWESMQPVEAAAGAGNLEAVQFLLERRRMGMRPDQEVPNAPVLGFALGKAVKSGSIPIASWLRQQGAPLEDTFFMTAARQGDVPMVRWLLIAGCRRGAGTLGQVVRVWPIGCTADGQRLLEAVRLLEAAGWPAVGEGEEVGGHPLVLAAYGGQPYSVWCALRELLPAGAREVLRRAAIWAARAGSQATLEALAGLGALEGIRPEQAAAMYALAAGNGDRGTLECLLRLGVPLGEGAMAAAVREGSPLASLGWLEGQGAQLGGPEAQELLSGMEDMSLHSDMDCRQRAGLEAWLRGRMGGVGVGGMVGSS